MSEGGVGTCPHVFVVDSQANYITMPTEKKQRCTRAGHRLLLLLVGLALLGLIVEAYFITKLYQKTETICRSRAHPLCQNQSNPKASGQQDGNIMSLVGSEGDLRHIPTVQTQIHQRPFAHLLGSNNPVGENNVIQWTKEGEAITQNMAYDKGRLTVEISGYYYLYSKVQLNAAEECLLIQHKVMRNTSAYGNPIELMKSRSFRCWTPKPLNAKASGMEDLWNNFLAGIFYLQQGDKIFVTLESKEKIQMRPGLTENFMGAFMVFP